jgi:ADP-ribose pyrophosphatase YjhB (NUDIX family)
VVLLAACTITGCQALFGGGIDYDEASDTVVRLVNEALDAGLDGRERPEPLGFGNDPCTDDLIGPTSQVSPGLSYSFPYTALGIASETFAENATETWRAKGMEITVLDSPRLFERFAVSEEGYRFSLTINEETDHISIGGSGPCVDPPE